MVQPQQTIGKIGDGSYTPGPGGVLHFDASNNGVGYSPEHDGKGLITADIKSKLDAALAAMKAGTLKTCPDTCGTDTGS